MSNSVTDSLKQEDTKTYYTPEIEEFRVGFEYEQLNRYAKLVVGAKVTKTWVKETWSEDDLRDSAVVYNLNIEDCRVKHLDREDIESLGFEELETMLSNPPIYRYGNKDTGVTLNLRNQKVGITVPERERAVGGYRTIFEGTIKNKSELKRLLKQLSIDAS
jgi:hypothetical protein